MHPLHDYVAIKRKEKTHETAGGIVIPDTAAEKPGQGEVIAVGDGMLLKNGAVKPLDVHVGDQVLFSEYAGTDVKMDGQDVLLMHESDILGIMEG